MKLTLKSIRAKALAEAHCTIEGERGIGVSWGYWLIGTGWEDGTYANSLEELDGLVNDRIKEIEEEA